MQISLYVQNLNKNNLAFGKHGTIPIQNSQKRYEDVPSMEDLYPNACIHRFDWNLRPSNFCSHELDFLRKNKDITLQDRDQFFENVENREFDIGELMLIATDNSLRKGESGYIFSDKLPKIFKGQDKKEVADKITEILSKEKTPKEFKINGKKYNIKQKGLGAVGVLYKITDENGNKVALKHYYNEWNTANNGRVEILLSEQMNKNGVYDIPKFYMGNVADYKIGEDKKIYKKPQWLLTEFIEAGQRISKRQNRYIKGISWNIWAGKHKLKNPDASGSNLRGDYLVDLGGFYHSQNCPSYAPGINCYGYSALKNGILRGMGTEGAIRHYECWKRYFENLEQGL